MGVYKKMPPNLAGSQLKTIWDRALARVHIHQLSVASLGVEAGHLLSEGVLEVITAATTTEDVTRGIASIHYL